MYQPSGSPQGRGRSPTAAPCAACRRGPSTSATTRARSRVGEQFLDDVPVDEGCLVGPGPPAGVGVGEACAVEGGLEVVDVALDVGDLRGGEVVLGGVVVDDPLAVRWPSRVVGLAGVAGLLLVVGLQQVGAGQPGAGVGVGWVLVEPAGLHAHQVAELVEPEIVAIEGRPRPPGIAVSR